MKYRRYSVLVFNKFYIPGYKGGGPIRTIANLVDRLGSEFNFRVVTSDRDSGEHCSYRGIVLNDWTEVGASEVRYLNPRSVSLRTLAELIKESKADAIYLNSFFDSLFTLRILLLRKLGKLQNIPVILAPRGEFSEGALEIKKPRKMAYLFLAKLIGLYSNLTWQASSELEKRDLKKIFPRVKDKKIHIAIDLAPAINRMSLAEEKFKVPGKLKVVFLARLSPMKNLDFALQVLQKVSAQVEFFIYGPKLDPVYWEVCEALVKALPDNVQASWKGEVMPQNVYKTLSKHDLFFLPTRGENYGHVIHEALSSGLPVLISDQTPWQGLDAAGVGWVLPLDAPEKFARQIDEVAKWGRDELIIVAQAARDYAAYKAGDESALEANRAMFRAAILARSQLSH